MENLIKQVTYSSLVHVAVGCTPSVGIVAVVACRRCAVVDVVLKVEFRHC